jgi:outer membrane immunogenic protein
MAADMPVKAPVRGPAPVVAAVHSWTGFYVGAHAGYGWGRTTIFDLDDFCLGSGTCPTPSVKYSFNGAIGGAQAGYNWQAGNWVYGLEVDISLSGMKDTFLFRPPGPAVLSTEIDWFGTGRLRFGYAAGSALFYATGGFAFAHVENSMGVSCCSARVSDVRWGWTAGGGAEFAFAPQWTVRAEYLFVDIQKSGIASVAPPATGRFEWENRFHVARAALNYRFGGPVVARY